ncbi:MAG: hypothetical protein ABJO09_05760 [Hyphomicrobiales bacterium]|uniref:hypothetical protein n=1 Tax=Alphaproteobacteria TaxID=28211 RepID=UPI003296BF59
MRMIHTYEEYAQHYVAGQIKPDWGDGGIIERAKTAGWPLGRWNSKAAFLKLCREDPEKFETAHTDYGVDF